MASEFPEGGAGGGMIDRIKNILLKPGTEWDRIAADPMTERGIFTSWVIPLAAIGPVASFVGGQVFGFGAFGISFRPSLIGGLTTAVLTYVMSLVGVWLLARIVDTLAPSFGGVRDSLGATKAVAFAWTASFVAGIFGLIPSLGLLGLLGLYSLYLLYLGLPKLMKSPPDKAIGYTAVTIVCAVLIYLVVGAVAGAVTGLVAAPMLTTGSTSGSLNLPGVGSVDLAKIDAATKQIEASTKGMQAPAAGGGTAAAVKPVDPAVLAALLPASAGGWTRASIESSGASAGGIGGSKAEATYSLGDKSVTLSVTDLAALGGIAALGSAFNVQSSKQTATGYEKTETVDGRITSEEWDNSSHDGKYSTVVANRFVVEAEGSAPDINAIKQLAATIDLGKLAAQAK